MLKIAHKLRTAVWHGGRTHRASSTKSLASRELLGANYNLPAASGLAPRGRLRSASNEADELRKLRLDERVRHARLGVLDLERRAHACRSVGRLAVPSAHASKVGWMWTTPGE